jgi:hypothetical protein
MDILIKTTDNRGIVIKSSLIPTKSTRTSSGVQVISLKAGQAVQSATVTPDEIPENIKGIKKIKIPATGVSLD